MKAFSLRQPPCPRQQEVLVWVFGWEVTRASFFSVICQLNKSVPKTVVKGGGTKIPVWKHKISLRYVLFVFNSLSSVKSLKSVKNTETL